MAVAKVPLLAQRVPADADAQSGGFRGLAAFPRYWMGVIAQFAYVGAQVGVWSFVIRYTQFNTPGTAEKVAANNLLITLCLFFAGRFVGTLLMSKFRPATLLALFAAADVALCVAAALVGGDLGLYALMATSFFMSIQFPTIFTMSLRGLGAHTKSGSSFLVMAIVGGALIPPAMGLVSDASSINIAMLVPAVCFAVVWLFGMTSRKEAANS
jgi:FHS family L-fucose permease-like MFS transporter